MSLTEFPDNLVQQSGMCQCGWWRSCLVVTCKVWQMPKRVLNRSLCENCHIAMRPMVAIFKYAV